MKGGHRRLCWPGPAWVSKPRFDKEARFLAQSARAEAGQVHVPQDAPWLAGWLDELLAFPNGRHDDQVDSASQALDYLTWRAFPLHAAREPRERPAKVHRSAVSSDPYVRCDKSTALILNSRRSASVAHRRRGRSKQTLSRSDRLCDRANKRFPAIGYEPSGIHRRDGGSRQPGRRSGTCGPGGSLVPDEVRILVSRIERGALHGFVNDIWSAEVHLRKFRLHCP
jgi:hypothetical protein